MQLRAGVLEGRCPGLDGTEQPFIGRRGTREKLSVDNAYIAKMYHIGANSEQMS